MDCHRNIFIGDDCMISWNCQFLDSDYHKILDASGKYINENREIHIGNKVWIACNCIILKGTIVPNGSIIAAGSLVSMSLKKEKCIYGGQGRNLSLLKEGINWQDK